MRTEAKRYGKNGGIQRTAHILILGETTKVIPYIAILWLGISSLDNNLQWTLTRAIPFLFEGFMLMSTMLFLFMVKYSK